MLLIESAKCLNLSQREKLYSIIIAAYRETEKEIWGENYIRVFENDYYNLIDKDEVLVAFYDNKISGGIHYYKNKDSYTFSLLGVDFSLGGRGIGAKLITEVENIAIKNNCFKIEIEVLRVKDKDVKSKVLLDSLYKKLGYHYTHSEDCIVKIPPQKYLKLVAPSNFDFYQKNLRQK